MIKLCGLYVDSSVDFFDWTVCRTDLLDLLVIQGKPVLRKYVDNYFSLLDPELIVSWLFCQSNGLIFF